HPRRLSRGCEERLCGGGHERSLARGCRGSLRRRHQHAGPQAPAGGPGAGQKTGLRPPPSGPRTLQFPPHFSAQSPGSPRAVTNTKAVAEYVRHHYRHFNSAALIDAADGYIAHMKSGGKMMVTLAGAMSTAELGLSLAEMIRRDKVHIITCTGANLEEDVFNLVAHDHYVMVPNYRDLTPEEERGLLDRHLNRVT